MRCIGDAFSLCLLSDVVETGGSDGSRPPSGCRSVVDVRRACRTKYGQTQRDRLDSVLASVFKRADGGELKMWAERRTMHFDQAARCGANAGLLIIWTGTRHTIKTILTPRGRSLGPELARRSIIGGPKEGGEEGGSIPCHRTNITCASKRAHCS